MGSSSFDLWLMYIEVIRERIFPPLSPLNLWHYSVILDRSGEQLWRLHLEYDISPDLVEQWAKELGLDMDVAEHDRLQLEADVSWDLSNLKMQ